MVERARYSDRATRQPDVEIDAYLLAHFPGRTLDELDAMDWPRYLRALAARRVFRVEEQRTELIAGRIQTLSEEDLNQIVEHDELMARYG